MNKPQLFGQFRAILTALGTVLVTYGVTDGNKWQAVAGVLLAVASVSYGLLYHRDPGTPGKLRWSLVRKLANMIGSAVVTYGYVHPDKVEAIVAAISVLGPIFAAGFSWIDNSTPDDDEPYFNVPLWLLLAACTFLLPGCVGMTYTLATPYGDASMDAKGHLVIAPKARIIQLPIYREK